MYFKSTAILLFVVFQATSSVPITLTRRDADDIQAAEDQQIQQMTAATQQQVQQMNQDMQSKIAALNTQLTQAQAVANKQATAQINAINTAMNAAVKQSPANATALKAQATAQTQAVQTALQNVLEDELHVAQMQQQAVTSSNTAAQAMLNAKSAPQVESIINNATQQIVADAVANAKTLNLNTTSLFTGNTSAPR